PQVRAAAVMSLQQDLVTLQNSGEPPEPNLPLISALAPLLSDPTRLVRTEVAQTIAASRVSHKLQGTETTAYRAALQDCFDSAVLDNDLAMGHVRIGVLRQNLGQLPQAEEEYKTAIRVDPKSVGPRANLADLYERMIESAQLDARQLAQSGDRRAAEQT